MGGINILYWKNRKKGAAHIELILSFVIFIGFLIFLLAIFKPFSSQEGSSIYLDVLERGITENTSVKVYSFTLKLSEPISPCFWFEGDYIGNVKVKDKDNNFVGAFINKKKIYINSDKTFFYIFSSPAFEANPFNIDGCKKPEDGKYTLGLLRSFSKLSYSKLELLKQTYESDYIEIKKELKLPASENFLFILKETNGRIILEVNKTIPKGKVLSRNIPTEVVYANGTIKYAVLNIQTW